MTVYLATTTVTVYRGESTDEFGDSVDADNVYATGLPVAITEQRQRSYQPSEQRTTVVEAFTIRLRPGADVREGDRLVDERDGQIYQVTEVHHPPTLVGVADVRATAVQVGAVSVP